MTSSVTTAPQPRADRTVLGLDRAMLVPAALILGVILFFAVGLPAIDALVQQSNPIAAGTVLPAGRGVSFTPATGWELVPGKDTVDSKIGPGSVTVADAGVTFAITTGTFTGTLKELSAVVNGRAENLDGTHLTARQTSATTSQGVTGTVTAHRGATTEAHVYAFLKGKVAVQVLVTGPDVTMSRRTAVLNAMVDSIVMPAVNSKGEPQ